MAKHIWARETGTGHADKPTITSRAAQTLSHDPNVHLQVHSTSVTISAYPPRAPYSRVGRGGVFERVWSSAIGCGVPERRGQHPKFCVLCVGAEKTSMSRDVISVQVDLINDSSKNTATGR